MKDNIIANISQFIKKSTQREADSANNGEEFERCIMCGELTTIPVFMPIEFRENYELGCGQLCNTCYGKLNKATEKLEYPFKSSNND